MCAHFMKVLVLLHIDFGDTGTFQHIDEFANLEFVDNKDEPYLSNGTSAAKRKKEELLGD